MHVCVSTACHRHTRLTDYHFLFNPLLGRRRHGGGRQQPLHRPGLPRGVCAHRAQAPGPRRDLPRHQPRQLRLAPVRRGGGGEGPAGQAAAGGVRYVWVCIVASPLHNSPPHNTRNTTHLHLPPGPIVSLNRFERKKNIGLALEAFAAVRQELLSRRATAEDKAAAQAMRLVIAGACLGARSHSLSFPDGRPTTLTSHHHKCTRRRIRRGGARERGVPRGAKGAGAGARPPFFIRG